MKVHKTDKTSEVYTQEDCYIIEILNQETENISLAQCRVTPGTTTQLHALTNTQEIYYILEGSGIANISGESRTLVEGDCIIIAKDQPQSIKNTGQTDLIFLCICQPRFKAENYKDLS